MTRPDTGPLPARHVAVALGAFLVMLGASIVLSGLSLLHPDIVADLFVGPDGAPARGGQPAFLAYFTFMTLAIVATTMFVSGGLLARFGARTMLLVGAGVMAVGLATFASASEALGLYAGGVLVGVGYGLSLALIPAIIVTAWFEARRGLVLGVVLAGSGVGGLLWSVLAPQLARSLGWRATTLGYAAAVLALAAVAALLIRNQPEDVGLRPYGAGDLSRVGEASEQPGLTFAEALRSPWFWVAGVAFVLFGYLSAVTQVLSIFLKTFAGADLVVFSTLVGVWTSFLIVWKPLLGLLNDRLGLPGMLAISAGLMSVGLVYLPQLDHHVPQPNLLLPVLAMIAVSAGIANATVTPPLVIAQLAGPREFGRILSTAVSFYYLGNAFGAPLWGAIQATSGSYNAGLYTTPIVLALFALGSALAARRGRRRWAPVTPG